MADKEIRHVYNDFMQLRKGVNECSQSLNKLIEVATLYVGQLAPSTSHDPTYECNNDQPMSMQTRACLDPLLHAYDDSCGQYGSYVSCKE